MRSALSILGLCSVLGIAAQAAPAVAEAPKEVLDTSKAQVAAPLAQPGPAVLPTEAAAPGNIQDTSAAAQPAPARADTQTTALLSIYGPGLAKLDLGGTMQVKGLYHDMLSDRDADKRLSLTLRRFKLDLDGAVDPHFGFRGQLNLDGNAKSFSVDDAYLYYTVNDLVGFKGGKLKRPFSQEALSSSKSLYTVERGELYFDFLANTTGYSYYDVGLMAYGGFEEEGHVLGYEIGIFNGKQNDDGGKDYSGQQNEATDKGFLAKDLVMRITATPIPSLKLEAAVSTKAAEDTSDSDNFKYEVNTAYEVGFNWVIRHLRVLGEASWGDNHNRRDSRIINGGSSQFFAFYGTGVWREDYSRGRASELVVKLEGLDPDFAWAEGKGKPNDGLLHYTLGLNYFFNPRVSVLADYGVLQPVTEVSGEKDLVHGLDAMWRLSF